MPSAVSCSELSSRLAEARRDLQALRGRQAYLIAQIRRYWPGFQPSGGMVGAPDLKLPPDALREFSMNLREFAALRNKTALAQGRAMRLSAQFDRVCRAVTMSGLGVEPSRIVVTASEQIASCLAKGGQWIIAEPGRWESGVCVPQGTPWSGPGTRDAGSGGGGAAGDKLFPEWCEQKGVNWCLVGGVAAALIALSVLARR